MANIIGGTQQTVTWLNAPGFVVDVVNVPTSGTPVNLPAHAVPDGFDVVIRAHRQNGAKIVYLAAASLDTADPTKRIDLKTGEVVTIRITNTNAIWIDASANNAKVEVLIEQ